MTGTYQSTEERERHLQGMGDAVERDDDLFYLGPTAFRDFAKATATALRLASRISVMTPDTRLQVGEVLKAPVGWNTGWLQKTFEPVAVRFRYRNYKGEVADRIAVPVQVFYGTTPHHPHPQWLLNALDLDKGEERDFALSDVQQWHTDLEEHVYGPEVSGEETEDEP